jgi:hypothetical protein
MKKLLLFVLVFFTTGSLIAQTFTVDGINYTVTGTSPATVKVSTNSGFTGAAIIPASVTNGGTTYSVNEIQGSAFYNCIGLTSVTIPNSVTIIYGMAFYNCSGLTSVILPDSITRIEFIFQNCTGLTSITIPDSVTSISQFAFLNCTGLTSITIPDSVTSIERWAFKGCTGLTSVTVNWAIPLAITSYVFEDVNIGSVTLNVPAGTETLYNDVAVWKDFNPIVLATNSFSITNKLKMYPNPTSNQININFEGLTNPTLEVYDVNGKQVIHKTSTALTNHINMNHLQNGMYLFKVSSKEGTLTEKVIKN